MMVRCTACGRENDRINAYCTECGDLLQTNLLEAADGLHPGTAVDEQALVSAETPLTLIFIFPRNSISIPFPTGAKLTLGRQAKNATKSLMSRIGMVENTLYYAALKGSPVHLKDPISFLSLVPFGATVAGVSRSHAVIRREQRFLTIEDLGSSNGTHLNGQRLVPGDKVLLHRANEVRLGQLGMTIRLSIDATLF